jgi:hypothetical protein
MKKKNQFTLINNYLIILMKSLLYFLIFVLILHKSTSVGKENNLMFTPYLSYEYATKTKYNFVFDLNEEDFRDFLLMEFLFIRNKTIIQNYENFNICRPYSTLSSCHEENYKKIKDFQIYTFTKWGENCSDVINEIMCYGQCSKNAYDNEKNEEKFYYSRKSIRISHSTCYDLFSKCSRASNITNDYIDFCENKLNLPKLKLVVGESKYFFEIDSNAKIKKENLHTAFIYLMRNYLEIFESARFSLLETFRIDNLINGSVEKHLFITLNILYPNFKFIEPKLQVKSIKILSHILEWLKFTDKVYKNTQNIFISQTQYVRIFISLSYKLANFLLSLENANFQNLSLKNFFLKSKNLEALFLALISESEDDYFLKLFDSEEGKFLSYYIKKFHYYLWPGMKRILLEDFASLLRNLKNFIFIKLEDVKTKENKVKSLMREIKERSSRYFNNKLLLKDKLVKNFNNISLSYKIKNNTTEQIQISPRFNSKVKNVTTRTDKEISNKNSESIIRNPTHIVYRELLSSNKTTNINTTNNQRKNSTSNEGHKNEAKYVNITDNKMKNMSSNNYVNKTNQTKSLKKLKNKNNHTDSKINGTKKNKTKKHKKHKKHKNKTENANITHLNKTLNTQHSGNSSGQNKLINNSLTNIKIRNQQNKTVSNHSNSSKNNSNNYFNSSNYSMTNDSYYSNEKGRFLKPLLLSRDFFNRTAFDLLTYDISLIGEVVLYYLAIISLFVVYCVLIKVLLNKCHEYFLAHNYKLSPDNYTHLFTNLALFLVIGIVIGYILYSDILMILLFAIDSELITASFIFHFQYGKAFGPIAFSFFALLVSLKIFSGFSIYLKISAITVSTLLFFYAGVYIGLHKFVEYERVQGTGKVRQPFQRINDDSSVN